MQGFALVDVIFVCGIIGILAVIAMPRMLLARQSAGSASAIGSMRTITSAQLTFALTCGGGFYAPRLTTLGTPPSGSATPFISDTLGQSDLIVQSGLHDPDDVDVFSGRAIELQRARGRGDRSGVQGGGRLARGDQQRFFSVNADGQIFEDSVSLFAAMPEVGEPPSGSVLK